MSALSVRRFEQDGDRDNPMKECADGEYMLASEVDAAVANLISAAKAVRFDVFVVTTPEMRKLFDGRTHIAVLQPDTIESLKAALAAMGAK